MASTFGERLKSARIAKRLTQKQLAFIIGAKHNSISGWENDKNKPDPDTIELLCGVLDISPNYLLGIASNDVYSPEEKELVKKYRTLDPLSREIVNFVLEKESERNKAATTEDPKLFTIAKVARSQKELNLTEEQMKAFAESAKKAPNRSRDKGLF